MQAWGSYADGDAADQVEHDDRMLRMVLLMQMLMLMSAAHILPVCLYVYATACVCATALLCVSEVVDGAHSTNDDTSSVIVHDWLLFGHDGMVCVMPALRVRSRSSLYEACPCPRHPAPSSCSCIAPSLPVCLGLASPPPHKSLQVASAWLTEPQPHRHQHLQWTPAHQDDIVTSSTQIMLPALTLVPSAP